MPAATPMTRRKVQRSSSELAPAGASWFPGEAGSVGDMCLSLPRMTVVLKLWSQRVDSGREHQGTRPDLRRRRRAVAARAAAAGGLGSWAFAQGADGDQEGPQAGDVQSPSHRFV